MSKQKYEQEIEDILRKYEEEKAKREPSGSSGSNPVSGQSSMPSREPIDFCAAQARRDSYSRSQGRGFQMPNWKRLSAAQYIGLAVATAVLAVVVGRAIPFLTGVLVILSAILFLVPFLLYRSSGGSGTTSGGYSPMEEKRWRGQKVDYTPGNGEDPFEGIKRWFRRR